MLRGQELSAPHMTKFSSFLLAVLLGISTAAQNDRHQEPGVPDAESPVSPELKAQLIALRDAALADDYAYKQVSHLTENIGPRPSGSPQSVKGAQYVADEMRSLGLEVHLEDVKVPHWVRGAETAELIDFPGQPPNTSQHIVVTSLGGSTSTPADGLIAEIVVVRNFHELAALGRDKV